MKLMARAERDGISTAPRRDLAQHVGAQIRRRRKVRGWKLRDLAARMRTTPQTVQRLEAAKITMSMDWLDRIADALDVEPWQLLGVDGVLGRANDRATKAEMELTELRGKLCDLVNGGWQ